MLRHPDAKWSHRRLLLWWSHILSTAFIANCLRAYLCPLGVAGFSAQCLGAPLGPRGANDSEGETGGKELKRWGRRRGSIRWNEKLSYKAVRATHLFIWGSLSSLACVAFLLPINAGLWMKTWLYIFKSAGNSSGEVSRPELGIIDVPMLIVWCVIMSGAGRSITAAIPLGWAAFVTPRASLDESSFLGNNLRFNLCPYTLQDTGKLNVSYFRFDINDATGELDANRPVPFRLTPNISEFLTTIGVSGPLTASMIAVARCFAQPNFKVTLSQLFSLYDTNISNVVTYATFFQLLPGTPASHWSGFSATWLWQ